MSSVHGFLSFLVVIDYVQRVFGLSYSLLISDIVIIIGRHLSIHYVNFKLYASPRDMFYILLVNDDIPLLKLHQMLVYYQEYLFFLDSCHV